MPAGLFRIIIARLRHELLALTDRPVPDGLWTDPEQLRSARLISRFGFLGSLFGIAYAAFYILIGHKWGATITLVCSASFAATPFLMRGWKSMRLTGNFLVFTLMLGFGALCFVEGGLHGHAIAWLVTVPLCALLLVGRKAAVWWVVISFLTASVVAGIDLAGKQLPVVYDHKWNSVVSAAGYLGLIIFHVHTGIDFCKLAGRARLQKCRRRLRNWQHRMSGCCI